MIARRAAAALLTLTIVAASAAGCGGESGPASTASSTASTADPQRQLEAAVRDAIRRDHAESVQILWTNRVPAHPVATAGPAVKQWRQSVADRRRAGVRVRSLSQRLHIFSVRLDPSYETAKALVRADQRVQQIKKGRQLGEPVELHERAQLLLHRVDGDRFVVWRVEVLRR